MKRKFLGLLLTLCLTAGLFLAATGSAETTAAAAPDSTAAPTSAPTSTPTAASAPAATTAPASVSTEATTPSVSADSISLNLCEKGAQQNYLAVLTVTKGGDPAYATTTNAGIPTLVTNGSTPSNNYVKFEYPENGLPTVTLMNAKLRSTGVVMDLSDFDISVKIVVAGNSTIESTGKYGIYRESYGDISIVGPRKLTLSCSSSAIAFGGDAYANSLTLKGLTLNATTVADMTGRTIHIPAGNLTVDSSNVSIVNRLGNALYLGQGAASDAKGRGNAIISDSVFSASSKNTALQVDGNLTLSDSNVQFTSDTRALYCIGNLSLNSSTLTLTGHSNSVETLHVGGEFLLRTSSAEIIGTKFVIFSNTTRPITLGEYSAVAGISKESAVSYNEAIADAYQYYYAESLEQPTEPTVPSETSSPETDPTGTDPTGTDPTNFSTEPTASLPTEPTAASSATQMTTSATAPSPTLPVNSVSARSNTLFWILAGLMVLGACGSAVMAIMMFRRSAEEDYEDEQDKSPAQLATAETEEIPTEEPAEIPAENTEEIPPEEADETGKPFLKKLKRFFSKKRQDDIPAESIPDENTPDESISTESIPAEDCSVVAEDTNNNAPEESGEQPPDDIDAQIEDIIREFHEDAPAELLAVDTEELLKDIAAELQEDVPAAEATEATKDSFFKKLQTIFAKLLEDDIDDTDDDAENPSDAEI